MKDLHKIQCLDHISQRQIPVSTKTGIFLLDLANTFALSAKNSWNNQHKALNTVRYGGGGGR